jgi:hypothetical protein
MNLSAPDVRQNFSEEKDGYEIYKKRYLLSRTGSFYA